MCIQIRLQRAFVRLLTVLSIVMVLSASAQAALTVTPLTWNVIGLDSNDPATGPQHFPVGARVCSTIATTNVSASLVFTSANANINARPGSLTTLTFPSIAAGGCVDAYYEVAVTQIAAAFDTTRRYRIDATDGTGTYSSPVPRELYVERLVSQSRNAISNVRYGTNPGNLTAVPAGGGMNLVVGNTYTIELSGGTATQGYEQFEAFINFTNTIFQILSVSTTYSADTTPHVSSPNDKLYGDACLWDNDPNSPTYRNCRDVGKIGGSNVVSTYVIRVVGGGGTQQTLRTLLYDFSGSSFHYNADFSTGARVVDIVDPTTASIAKAFVPNTTNVGGVSTLRITLSNPNTGALAGYNFIDNLPTNMTVANPPNASTSNCGTPTFAPTAGATSLSFSNGTVGAGSTCTISVSVTTSTVGTFTNTTNNLFIDTTDTGDNASAVLTVNNTPPPPPGLCGQTLATWRFPSGFNVNAPVATSSIVPATAAAGAGLVANTQTTLTADGTAAWGSNGSITPGAALVQANNEFFEFVLNTTTVTEITANFNMLRRSNNGPQGVAFTYGPVTGTETTVFTNSAAIPTQNTTVALTSNTINTGLNPAGTTRFRIYSFNSNNDNPGSDPVLDDVVFTGCAAALQPTVAKSFAPNPIAVGGTSTLTLVLSNPNSAPLTGAAITDNLPTGMTVAATPAATNTCGGTFAPVAAATSISLSGGTIPANGSCTLSVSVTTNVVGPSTNITDFISTTQSGTNTGNGGSGTATLIALAAPSISKQFSPNPIIPNGISRLTFQITNPNPNHAIASVAFADTLPTVPGQMRVAATPNASTTNCGAPVFAPAASATSLSFTGGTIAAGGICTVAVDVTAPVVGTYNNISGNVSYVINGGTVIGNTASAPLTVEPPNPAIALLKEVGPTATGPWSSFLAVNLPASVFYRFTIENIGDVPLSALTLTDPPGGPPVPGCVLPATLDVADALDDGHLFSCVSGPVTAVSGLVTNTARAGGTNGATTVTDDDTATYGTTSLTMVKTATPTTYTAAGQVISYSFLVTNNGFAALAGPVTINDDRTINETCPAVTSVGDLDNFLDPGESITCSATYVITAGDVSAGSVLNTATATAGGVTSLPDSETVTLLAPRLTTAKSGVLNNSVVAPNDQSNPGDTIAYTITVANIGNDTATSVNIADSLAPLALSCTINAVGTALPANLPAGQSLVCTGTYVLTAGDVTAGSVTNVATTTAGNVCNPTTAGSTCSGTDVRPLNVFPLLATSKVGVLNNTVVAPNNQSNPGDTIAYTITVANSGNGAATNVSIADSLAPLVLTCTVNAAPATLPTTVPAGQSLVCTGTYTLTAGDVTAGSVTNTATTTATNVCNPTSPGSTCTGIDVRPLDVFPILTTTKTGVLDNAVVAPPTQSNPGDTIAYTITVVNSGNGVANAVTIADSLPITLGCTISGGPVSLPVNLNAGASLVCTGTYTLVAADITAGSVTNTATTTAANVCNPTTAGSTCSGVDVRPLTLVPVLSIDKVGVLDNSIVPPPDQSNVGDRVNYTITVTNSGNGPANSVTIADSLPVAPLVCTISGGPVTLPTTLAAGASLICTTSYTLTGADITAGQVINVATVTSANGCNPPGSGAPCNDTELTPLGVVPVLTLVKDVVPAGASFVIGQTGTYTISVTNSGNAATTGNIVVTDTLATGITLQGFSGTGWACVGTTALTCTYSGAPLAANGGSTTLTLTVNVGNNATTGDNSAVLTGGGDPTCPAATRCGDIVVVPITNPQLTVTKTATPGSFVIGQQGTYTIVVSNTGSASTFGAITITDTLPTGINFVSAAGAGWNCVGAPNLVCTYTGANLAPNGSTTLTLTVDVTASAVTGDNLAVGSGGGDPTCPAAARCDDLIPVPITAPRLSIDKTASAANFVVGQPGTYTVTVSNIGTASTFGNIVVTDTLPANVTFNSAVGTNWACVGAPNLVCTYTGPALAPTASTSFVITVTPTAAAQNADNGASVTGGGDPTCPGQARCSDVVPVGIVRPDLTIDKSHTGNFARGQQGAQYSIVVRNVGTAPSTGLVTVTDTLPVGLTATGINGSGWTCVLATLTCERSDVLAANASYPPITLTVDVAADAPATVINIANVSGGGDDNPSNNSDSDPATVSAPDLAVIKTHVGTFTLGQIGAVYLIEVSNMGAVPTVGPVSVTDTLPAGLTATGITGTGWNCVLATLTCTRSDVLGPNQAWPIITLTVNVAPNAPNTLTNVVVVSGGGDSNPGNNTDTDPVTLASGEPPLPVPVDQAWLLALMAALMLIAAMRQLGTGRP